MEMAPVIANPKKGQELNLSGFAAMQVREWRRALPG